MKPMRTLNLEVISGEFTLHRFPPKTSVSKFLKTSSFFNVTKTEDELSVVCPSALVLPSKKRKDGFACIKIQGILDFSLLGVLAGIAGVLAKEGISVLAISTYNTDYFLIPKEKLNQAISRLQLEGHTIVH
jgi:hypothetical protein